MVIDLDLDLDLVPDAERPAVEREIGVRMRAEDGTFGSTTLGDLIASDRVQAKAVADRDGASVDGVLVDWPGYEQPQVLPVSEVLWRAVAPPEVAALKRPGMPESPAPRTCVRHSDVVFAFEQKLELSSQI